MVIFEKKIATKKTVKTEKKDPAKKNSKK